MFLENLTEIDAFGWKEPGIGPNLVYFVGTGISCFLILLIIEYRVLNGLIYLIRGLFQKKLPSQSENGFIDEDVHNEKIRVTVMSPTDIEINNLVLKGVSKYYGKFLAVNQISIGIQQ